MKEYKRQYRELEDATKQKISQSSKNRPKSETHKPETHKQHISQAMIDYWETVEHRPDDETTMDDII